MAKANEQYEWHDCDERDRYALGFGVTVNRIIDGAWSTS